VVIIITHLESVDARLHRAVCLAPDAALLMTKKDRGRHSNGGKGDDRNGDDRKGDHWNGKVICHGCVVMGHIKAKCSSKHKLASYEKSKIDANLTTSTSNAEFESESFLFLVIQSDPIPDSTPDSVITVNVALANRYADDWIVDTAAKNYVTGNRNLFETFHSMAQGEHQDKTANSSFVNAEGSGTITLYVDRPNAKPAQIAQQHVLYVTAGGTNNVLNIIQFIQTGVNFDFKLNGATASLGSVLVYEAPLINSLFVLRASTTSDSVSKASVEVDDPPCTTPNSGISEASSIIRPADDDMEILIWHAYLGHLSL